MSSESPSSDFELPTLKEIMKWNPRKRRASSIFSPSEGTFDSSSVVTSSSPCRNTRSKTSRHSGKAMQTKEEPQVRIEATTYPVYWQPPSFRHPCCGQHENRPCQSDLVPQVDTATAAHRRTGRVMDVRPNLRARRSQRGRSPACLELLPVLHRRICPFCLANS